MTTLQWNSDDTGGDGVEIGYYEVNVTSSSCPDQPSRYPTTSSVTITGLSCSCDYSIIVRAVNCMGASESAVISITGVYSTILKPVVLWSTNITAGLEASNITRACLMKFNDALNMEWEVSANGGHVDNSDCLLNADGFFTAVSLHHTGSTVMCHTVVNYRVRSLLMALTQYMTVHYKEQV